MTHATARTPAIPVWSDFPVRYIDIMTLIQAMKASYANIRA